MNKLDVSTEQLAALNKIGLELNTSPARSGDRERLLIANGCSCFGGCADVCSYGCFGGR